MLQLASLIFIFIGTYLSLRSIFVSRLERRLDKYNFDYKNWGEVPLYDRIIFRFFGITNLLLFKYYEHNLAEKEKTVIKSLYNYWEPFWALLLFVTGFILQIIVIL